MDSAFKEAVTEKLLERLAMGDSMNAICQDEGMPSRETVRLWAKDDPEFELAITCAREAGFEIRAEKAVQDAKTAEDASKGRLAFDAERWYLGKLSKAFSDKVKHVGGDAGDAPINMKVEEVRRVVIDPHNPDTA